MSLNKCWQETDERKPKTKKWYRKIKQIQSEEKKYEKKDEKFDERCANIY